MATVQRYMAFYQKENTGTLTVDFGGGRSLTFITRARNEVDVLTRRDMGLNAKRAVLINRRIERLSARAARGGLENDALQQTQREIEQLRARDSVEPLVDYVVYTTTGWTDYFIDGEAEQRGELAPFSKEDIKRMGASALSVVATRLNEQFGI